MFFKTYEETRDKRQETRDKRQETGDRRQETRDKTWLFNLSYVIEILVISYGFTSFSYSYFRFLLFLASCL